MNPDLNPPVAPAPQHDIPNDIVEELPMNNNSFEDVIAPVTSGPPPPGGPTPPAPPPPGQDPMSNPTPLDTSAPAGTANSPGQDSPGSTLPSGLSSLRAKLPWAAPGKDITKDIATGQPSAFGAPEPVTNSSPSIVQGGNAPALDTPSPAPPIQVSGGDQADLLDVKKDALKELSPLVEHIDQKPQERFKTLLDMIRASDDVTLVRPAYAAAQAIEDDKDRAQALLEIVKEVNYLTQTKDESAPPPPPTP